MNTDDQESDRFVYVEMRSPSGWHGGRTFANAAEAIHFMDHLPVPNLCFRAQVYLKSNDRVMGSTRFRLSKQPRTLRSPDLGWLDGVLLRTRSVRAQRANYRRPFGVRARPTMRFRTGRSIHYQLQTSLAHVRRPLVLWSTHGMKEAYHHFVNGLLGRLGAVRQTSTE